jgi:hypothetical protein
MCFLKRPLPCDLEMPFHCISQLQPHLHFVMLMLNVTGYCLALDTRFQGPFTLALSSFSWVSFPDDHVPLALLVQMPRHVCTGLTSEATLTWWRVTRKFLCCIESCRTWFRQKPGATQWRQHLTRTASACGWGFWAHHACLGIAILAFHCCSQNSSNKAPGEASRFVVPCWLPGLR